MKKSILFFGFVFATTLVSAQNFNVGVKAGIGTSRYSFDDDLEYVSSDRTTAVTVKRIGSVVSYNIGVISKIDIPLIPVSARLGIQYINLGGQVEVREQARNTNRYIDENNGRVDIPIQLTVYLSKFRLIGGVGYSIDISRSTAVVDYLNTEYVETGRFDFAVQSQKMNYWTYNVGAGFETQNWGFEILWEGPMSEDISSNVDQSVFTFAPNAGQFSVNFIYYLMNRKKKD
jgi:hypothetical protein